MILKKKKPKKIQDKIINSFIGLATGLTRLKLNYAENNGKVLPGYTQSLGFLGTSRPSLAFVFGSQNNQLITLNYLIARTEITVAAAVSIFTGLGFFLGVLVTLLWLVIRRSKKALTKNKSQET